MIAAKICHQQRQHQHPPHQGLVVIAIMPIPHHLEPPPPLLFLPVLVQR